MGLHRFFSRNVCSVFHHSDMVRIGRIKFYTKHQSSHFIKRIIRRSSYVGSVRGIRIHINIVPVFNIQVFGCLRVEMKLLFTNSRSSFIHTIGIAKIRIPDLMPIYITPHGMNTVPAFRSHTVKLESFFPKEVFRFFNVFPRHTNVSYCSMIPVFGILRNAIIFRTNIRIGTHNNIRKIRRCFRPFAMHNKIFSVLNGFRNIRIGMHPSGVRMKGLIVMDLLPKRNPRISPEKHQSSSRRAVLPIHDVLKLISCCRCA